MRKSGNGDGAREGKERFLLVGFLQIVHKRLDCFCLCRWEDCSRSRFKMCTTYHAPQLLVPYGTSLGFSLFPYSCNLKYRGCHSKTAKRFAHITVCKVFWGFRQEKNYLQVLVSIFFHFSVILVWSL